MQITNGTVSRTYKTADYEGRTVTLSFAVDPGDDVDAGLAVIAALAEKHARQVPAPVANPVQRVAPSTLDQALAGKDAVAPEHKPAAVEVPVITDVDLTKACQAATARMKTPEPTKEVIGRFVEKPGMRASSIPMDKRADFVKALEALKPATDAEY